MVFGSRSSGGDRLGANSLLVEFRHFIDAHPLLEALNAHHQTWPMLTVLCEELEAHQTVLLALTELHSRSQMDFERGLFCAWMSLLVARELKLGVQHQQALFFAGLLQDLGRHIEELSVRDFTTAKRGPFVAQSYRAGMVDSHPLVTATFLEANMEETSRVNDLVLHHHARDDGTGFPQHVGEPQLDIDDQILIVANELSDQLDTLGGHNQLLQCIPRLKLGSAMYFHRAHAAWLQALAPVTPVTDVLLSPYQCEQLSRKRGVLEKVLASLLAVSGELLRYDFDLHVHGLRSSIQKMARLFAETGLLNAALFQHTCESGLRGEHHSCRSLQDVADMFVALPSVLQRCAGHIDYLLAHSEFAVNHHVLSDALSRIHQCCAMLAPPKSNLFR